MTWGVFLDRDGVLTEAPVIDGKAMAPTHRSELRIVAGARAALDRLREAGAVLIVVTNQPDITRGGLRQDELDAMHERLASELPIDDIEVCPHSGAEQCDCRKPRPGMLIRAAAAHGIDRASSWMVGDRWVDILAGREAGTGTVLVDRPYSWSATSAGSPPDDLVADHHVADVGGAADVILGSRAG
jgi:D-glycero-D-manno-heptose 1,7-bisphosphate phosphatase